MSNCHNHMAAAKPILTGAQEREMRSCVSKLPGSTSLAVGPLPRPNANTSTEIRGQKNNVCHVFENIQPDNKETPKNGQY